MNTHTCIKCQAEYQDGEVDAYYCPACAKSKAAIAAEIDAKLANRPKKETMSDLQMYERAPKVRGFADARFFM